MQKQDQGTWEQALDSDIRNDNPTATVPTYAAPTINRLGTLTELTLGGAGAIDDTFNGGWQGSFLPP